MQAFGPPPATSPNHGKRLVWLLACVFVGLVIAIIGAALSGSSVWYVAVPAVVAVGWLVLANPAECEPPLHQRANRSNDNETEP